MRMPRQGFRAEDVIAKLREADVLLGRVIWGSQTRFHLAGSTLAGYSPT
jgi:hypothetical protein